MLDPFADAKHLRDLDSKSLTSLALFFNYVFMHSSKQFAHLTLVTVMWHSDRQQTEQMKLFAGKIRLFMFAYFTVCYCF